MTVLTARTAAATSPLRVGRRLAGSLAFVGPAFVAGIAYVDPGNVATNFGAGSRFGYRLLWVVLGANVIAALMQTLSAKIGLATGRNLAEITRERCPRPVAVGLWLQAEVVVMATDLAEIVGGALALELLFGLPLPVGAAFTAVIAYALLALRRCGRRVFEIAVLVLFAGIGAGFCFDLFRSGPSWTQAAGGLTPGFAGADSVVLATAIVGATVMPHAIYLHSALTQRRSPVAGELTPRRALRLQRIDIGLAMGTAGFVNAAMLVVAAGALAGVSGGIDALHSALAQHLGALAALAFALALLASGLASSGVGTLAGDVVMAGYLRRRIPALTRRLVTLLPGLALLLGGVSATDALVLSQFVLGLGIPFAIVPLVLITRNRAIMGELVNRRGTTVSAVAAALMVIAIDGYATALMIA